MADSPEVLDTQLTLSAGATIAVNTGGAFSEWAKPAASFSVRWAGVPNEEQVRLATRFIQSQILNPIIKDVVASAQARLAEACGEP